MLAASVDLLWFGGIGTYVKAPDESHAEVGDRANDALRIDGDEIRAKVVGEGANLGVTQRGRVAYALAGGRIDTDAIDNSAGVDTSDHEVNLKILIDRAIAAGALPAADREPLLHAMTEEVAALVLRDNYLQGEALSVAEARGAAALDRQARLIRELEKSGRLDRALEFLPDDETLASRAAHGQGLVRPELAVLLAYAKMALDAELLASDLPDAPRACRRALPLFPGAPCASGSARRSRPIRCAARSPPRRHQRSRQPRRHHLCQRHAGAHRPGRARRSPAPIWIVREIFDLPRLWAEIEALDDQVPARIQTEMLLEIATVVEHAAAWLLQRRRLDLAGDVARLAPRVRSLAGDRCRSCCRRATQAIADERAARFAEAGVPAALAARIGAMMFLAPALDIAELAERAAQPIDRAARVYYGVGVRFALDEMRAAARRLPAETQWQKLAVEATDRRSLALQARHQPRAILARSTLTAADPLAAWTAAHAAELAPTDALARELRASRRPRSGAARRRRPPAPPNSGIGSHNPPPVLWRGADRSGPGQTASQTLTLRYSPGVNLKPSRMIDMRVDGGNRDIGSFQGGLMRFGSKHNDIIPILCDMIRWRLKLPSRRRASVETPLAEIEL